MTADEIALRLGLKSTRTAQLLKRGVAERLLEKTAKPARYKLVVRQPTLF